MISAFYPPAGILAKSDGRRLTPPPALCNLVYMASEHEQPITDVLRKAVADAVASGEESFIGLERATGVLRQSLMTFARGRGSLRGDAYDKLALHFGLELRAKYKGRKGR